MINSLSCNFLRTSRSCRRLLSGSTRWQVSAATSTSKGIRESLTEIIKDSISRSFPNNEQVQAINAPEIIFSKPEFGHYQTGVAMKLTKPAKSNPKAIAEIIIANIAPNKFTESVTFSNPGFMNIRLSSSYIDQIASNMFANVQDRSGVRLTSTPQRTIVDFSSPNIAKEMHVGHLRSTIIGDVLSRILEFLGHDVLRLNHIGDWGTQFGMLICFLKEKQHLSLSSNSVTPFDIAQLTVSDLNKYYKEAKAKFDKDSGFRDQSRLEVYQLQTGDGTNRFIWQQICEVSRREYNEIYKILDISVQDRGESFYQPKLPSIIQHLEKQQLLVDCEGSKCMFIWEESKNSNSNSSSRVSKYLNQDDEPLPIILQKSDGAFLYASTDLAAIAQRISEERADRILYVTDEGQSLHFKMIFDAARAGKVAAAIDFVELRHVPFGLVLGEDGKRIRTRAGESIKLKELLSEAVHRAKQLIISRRQAGAEISDSKSSPAADNDDNEIDHAARVIGIGAVKYADLMMNRESNYKFSFDKMLSLNGNTAPYMLYAYARIKGIERKIGQALPANGDSNSKWTTWNSVKNLQTEEEIKLLVHLLRFEDILFEISKDLLPNKLCEYLYHLSQHFATFYEACPVVQAETDDIRISRYQLCVLTSNVLHLGLGLLGIKTLDRL